MRHLTSPVSLADGDLVIQLPIAQKSDQKAGCWPLCLLRWFDEALF